MINFRNLIASTATLISRVDLGTVVALLAVSWGTQQINKITAERVEALAHLRSQHDLVMASAIEWEGRRDTAMRTAEDLRQASADVDVDQPRVVLPADRRGMKASSSTVIGRGDVPGTEG